MAEVPVLKHGRFRLSQSGIILEYPSGRLGRYGPRDKAERREIMRWTLWDNHRLSSYTATWRFLTCFATETQRNPGAAMLFGERARAAMAILDAHLSERDWIVDERMGLVLLVHGAR